MYRDGDNDTEISVDKRAVLASALANLATATASAELAIQNLDDVANLARATTFTEAALARLNTLKHEGTA